MRLAGLLFAALLLAGCWARPPMVADYTPEERAARLARAAEIPSAHHQKRMELFLDNNPKYRTGGIVYFGDSITEGFPVTEAFPNLNVINRGIGGNRVSDLLSRIDTSIADLKPSRVYVMIGINDLTWGRVPVDELKKQYEQLVQEIQAASPGVDLKLVSTLPVRGRYEDAIPLVAELNENTKRLAEKYDCEYIDLWPSMADDQHRLREEYTSDGVHLTLAGYLRWLAEIERDNHRYINVVRDLAPRWAKANPRAWPLKAVDPSVEGAAYPGNRGPDEMLVYTPAYGKSTGTNPWGTEVIVIDGVVTERTVGDTPIPENGYVISGHGAAAAWITSNLPVGTPVEVRDGELWITSEPVLESHPWKEFWHAVVAMHEAQAIPSEWREARRVLKDLREMDAADAKRRRLKEKVLKGAMELNPQRYRRTSNDQSEH